MPATREADSRRPLGLEFWNRVFMVVVGYGAATLLIPAFVGFHRVFADLEPLDCDGLAILCLSTGTLGLLVFRDMFVERGWWREAQLAGYCQNTVCAAAALWDGNERLALLVVAIAAVAYVFNKVLRLKVGDRDGD